MKLCKSCRKEIDDSASKCPYCQSYQSWFKSPQVFGFVFPLIFIPIIFFMSGLWGGREYAGNESLFIVKEINHFTNQEGMIINYEIKNLSGNKWGNLTYQISLYNDKNDLLFVETKSEYSWKLPANDSANLSVNVRDSKGAVKWILKITELKTGRF